MLNRLPRNVLKRIEAFLDIKVLYNVGLTCAKLQEFIFGHKEALASDLLFPAGDESTDDTFV